MSWKTLVFTKPCKLYVKNFQLVYEEKDAKDKISIPLEDIGTIVLESHQINLTNYLLSSCADYNILVLTCDEKHRPNGILTPFYQHSRNTKIGLIHINIKEPLKKKIWQKIIQQKIKNQSAVLEILFDINELHYYTNKVLSGDTSNVEAFVSKKYWQLLFTDFKRHSKGKYNLALDYGYAIIRACISRYIASSGLVPFLGVHHCNELNPFNLTEDLIEPFRPFIDLMVSKRDFVSEIELTSEDKMYLLSILTKQCEFKGEQITVQNACEKTCKSFVKTITENNIKYLDLPQFIGQK